jgi:hypothetical protein
MRKVVGTLVAGMLLAAFAAVGCKPSHIDWPKAVSCFGTPSAELVAQVRSIVEQDGLDEALEDLARSHGPDVIACVLRELIDAFTAPTGMQSPPEKMAAARRIQDFFNEKQIQVPKP